MPFLGATLDSASIDATSKIVTVIGTNFGEAQAPVFDIQTSPTGENDWTSADSISGYSNTGATGTYTTALALGTYDVRVTTSDNVQLTLSRALVVRRNKFTSAFGIGIGI